jgi:hypothetical protein
MRTPARWAYIVTVTILMVNGVLGSFGAAQAATMSRDAVSEKTGPAHHCGDHARRSTGSTNRGSQTLPCCANAACQCGCPLALAPLVAAEPVKPMAHAAMMIATLDEPIDRGALAPLLRPPIV